ncbi:hypothetical protein [Actinacidiphila glaucinigra]|uniref:hypothetical protein n=1 Tax=Actinacidiphila glaucinigra TaxID=235986 RepID=UPI0036ECF516
MPAQIPNLDDATGDVAQTYLVWVRRLHTEAGGPSSRETAAVLECSHVTANRLLKGPTQNRAMTFKWIKWLAEQAPDAREQTAEWWRTYLEGVHRLLELVAAVKPGAVIVPADGELKPHPGAPTIAPMSEPAVVRQSEARADLPPEEEPEPVQRARISSEDYRRARAKFNLPDAGDAGEAMIPDVARREKPGSTSIHQKAAERGDIVLRGPLGGWHHESRAAASPGAADAIVVLHDGQAAGRQSGGTDFPSAGDSEEVEPASPQMLKASNVSVGEAAVAHDEVVQIMYLPDLGESKRHFTQAQTVLLAGEVTGARPVATSYDSIKDLDDAIKRYSGRSADRLFVYVEAENLEELRMRLAMQLLVKGLPRFTYAAFLFNTSNPRTNSDEVLGVFLKTLQDWFLEVQPDRGYLPSGIIMACFVNVTDVDLLDELYQLTRKYRGVKGRTHGHIAFREALKELRDDPDTADWKWSMWS